MAQSKKVTPRQQPIPVTSREREKLNQAKSLYEKKTGDTGDWGKFLTTTITLGLVAAGVYGMAKIIKSSRFSINVQCPQCDNRFVVALADESVDVCQVTCPKCQTELVVNVGR